MKKILLILTAFFLTSFSVQAQHIDDSSNTIASSLKRIVPAEKTVSSNSSVQMQQPSETADIKEEPEEIPPTTITPEQKAEINIHAKRQTRGTVRVQSPRQRRSFIDVLQMLDRKAARQQAISEGKSDRDVEKAGEEIEKPKVNPLNDSSMEKYLYEQVDVNERTKVSNE